MCYCSKCCTLKTSSRIVSIQVQLNLTLLSISNRTWSRHLSMSTRTQACNLSMPNQWVRSHELSMSTHRHKLVICNAKPMGTISPAINVNTQTQASNLSMPNQWARSINVNRRTQACNLSIPNQWARSINVNRRTQACNLSIPNLWARSQLITICSCITSFGYFRISAVRFTDHVQHNLSRCVQTVFITLVVRKVKSSNTFWVIAKKDGGGD